MPIYHEMPSKAFETKTRQNRANILRNTKKALNKKTETVHSKRKHYKQKDTPKSIIMTKLTQDIFNQTWQKKPNLS